MRYAFLGIAVPTVTCKNKDCEAEFVLYAVFRNEDGSDKVMHQVAAPYCPYCGQVQPRV